MSKEDKRDKEISVGMEAALFRYDLNQLSKEQVKAMKKKEIKLFKDLQAPNRHKSFKERTGKKFDKKVRYKIIDLGNGYGKTEKI